MTSQEFRLWWSDLEAFYPETQSKPKKTRNAWFLQMRHYRYEDVHNALVSIARRLKFTPSLSELLEELQDCGASDGKRSLFTKAQVLESVAWMRAYLKETEESASAYYKIHHSNCPCEQEESPANRAPERAPMHRAE